MSKILRKIGQKKRIAGKKIRWGKKQIIDYFSCVLPAFQHA